MDPYLYLHRGISGGRSDQSEEGILFVVQGALCEVPTEF